MLNLHYPSHWEMKRLGTLFSDNHLLNEDLRSLNALQFKYGDIIRKKKVDIDDDLLATWRHYTLVQKDDIMINGLNLNYDFVSKRVAIVREEGIITSAYISLRPIPAINARYYCYLLKAIDEHKILHGMGTGIRLTLSFSQLRNYHLPVPSREEQDQIVRYLDWQISKINRLIAAKKKEIVLLREYLEAKVSAYYHVPFPKCKIRFLIDTPLQYGANAKGEIYSEDKPRFIRITDIDNEGKLKDDGKQSLSIDQAQDYILHEGDILLARSGATVGKAFLYRKEYGTSCFAGYLIRCVPKQSVVLPEYIYYFTLTTDYWKYIQNAIIQATIPNVSAEKYKNLAIPLPGLEKQKDIVKSISFERDKIHKLIKLTQMKIDGYREYLVRLISDVVTGQIDVRGIEIPEFEMVEEQTEVTEIEDSEVNYEQH